MLEKTLIDKAFSQIKHGGITVTYWDGQTKRYGTEKPWVKIKFNDAKITKAMRKNLELAIGEGYMDGSVEVDGDLAELGRLGDANRIELDKYVPYLARKALEKTSKQRNFSDVQHHYDLGNDFYKLWLDKSMTYSCAYFKKASDSLDLAQRQKVDHILKKLALKRGMHLLDIGSGWGELIIRAAKKYGVKAHGITLSKEQYRATRDRIAKEGLTGRVTVELQHYEDLKNKKFDRVVSVGMYEHVGKGNHDKYFAAVDRLLRPGGVNFLHTITQFEDRAISPWTDKYIFPGGYLPTVRDTVRIAAEHDYRLIDAESLRRHYARTLHEWWKGFERHVPEITEMYDERFVRMWRLYLRGSYAGFAFGNLDLDQFVFTKGLSDEVPMTREPVYR